ncbi:unnamed protein product [Scytosiphon promiscuus]
MQFWSIPTGMAAFVLCVLVNPNMVFGQIFGDECSTDSFCHSKCCATGLSPSICSQKSWRGLGQSCFTGDGCDCEGDLVCDETECKEPPSGCADNMGNPDNSQCENGQICCPRTLFCGEPGTTDPTTCGCSQDSDCSSQCCASQSSPPECAPKGVGGIGESCFSNDGCDCLSSLVCSGGTCSTGCTDVDGNPDNSRCPTRQICCPDTLVCGEPARDFTICGCADVDGNPDNSQCGADEICCLETLICGEPSIRDPTVCGDPHMTGFLGQKFDFTGEDGGWYALIADMNLTVNMRVTSPVDGLPEITYITGLSVLTTDADGFDHSIVIHVKDPHDLDTSCPAEVSPCLADGSLRVVLDGEETLLAPGTVRLGQGVQISAANLPGACRSFGFEKYWERKQLENARHGRRLGEALNMGEWILGDPTATNMDECVEYVARAEAEDGGLFAHQSEHASFMIVTPKSTIRLSHGRLHQIAMRDPTDQYDLPNHLTWQMNVAITHSEVSHDAKGVLGETFVPTRDANGEPIMTGMEAIRGKQEDYRVEGALGMDFVKDAHTS